MVGEFVKKTMKDTHSAEDLLLATKISAALHPKLQLTYMGGGEKALLKIFKVLGNAQNMSLENVILG